MCLRLLCGRGYITTYTSRVCRIVSILFILFFEMYGALRHQSKVPWGTSFDLNFFVQHSDTSQNVNKQVSRFTMSIGVHYIVCKSSVSKSKISVYFVPGVLFVEYFEVYVRVTRQSNVPSSTSFDLKIFVQHFIASQNVNKYVSPFTMWTGVYYNVYKSSVSNRFYFIYFIF